MKNGRKKSTRKFWAVISPWFIIGAVVILVPIFIISTLENINKQKEYTTQLLLEKGEALVRSLEAGARTGMGLNWSRFQLQKLLIETAEQPGVDHISIIDTSGTIIADSDPSMIGEKYGTNLDLTHIASLKTAQWRQVPNPAGDDTFEVYRQFAPTESFSPGFLHEERARVAPSGNKGTTSQSPGLIIFVGMDMSPINALRKQDTRHTIMMSVIFVLIGVSGVVSLYLAQSYRMARVTLSRVKAFSDSLVEHMPIGLIAINDREEIISFNQTAETILGHSFQDVFGKKAGDILPPPCRDMLQVLKIEKRTIEKEVECPVKDGRTVSLEIIATSLEEETGDFLGYVILFRDITEILHLKKEIERSQRLASLGNIAAGIAHEIRNPLSSIKGFAQFFRERYRGNTTDRETADVMIQEVDRLNRVISQLLEFARPMNMNRQWTSLKEVIRHTLKMVAEEARGKNITIHMDTSSEPAVLFIDPDKITQVLLNLFFNAIGAMGKGGVLGITLSMNEAGNVQISVSDTGTGIRKEDMPRIFDPYFTTKPTGTGLGLAIVYRIIEAHDGEIRVESEEGRGTTVTVSLPAGPHPVKHTVIHSA